MLTLSLLDDLADFEDTLSNYNNFGILITESFSSTRYEAKLISILMKNNINTPPLTNAALNFTKKLKTSDDLNRSKGGDYLAIKSLKIITTLLPQKKLKLILVML